MLGYAEWVGWKPGEHLLTYVAGTGRDAWGGKQIMLASPPDFHRPQQERITPPGYVDRGFAWAPPCAGRLLLAAVRSGPDSLRDQYDRPLPAIYVDDRQESHPVPPFGDYAPSFDCQGRTAWVRISYDKAQVFLEGSPWVDVDVPRWYYGHWFTDEVMAWWQPGARQSPAR